jgi:hypothetical protein
MGKLDEVWEWGIEQDNSNKITAKKAWNALDNFVENNANNQENAIKLTKIVSNGIKFEHSNFVLWSFSDQTDIMRHLRALEDAWLVEKTNDWKHFITEAWISAYEWWEKAVEVALNPINSEVEKTKVLSEWLLNK